MLRLRNCVIWGFRIYNLEFGNWFSLSHIVWIMKSRMIYGNDT